MDKCMLLYSFALPMVGLDNAPHWHSQTLPVSLALGLVHPATRSVTLPKLASRRHWFFKGLDIAKALRDIDSATTT